NVVRLPSSSSARQSTSSPSRHPGSPKSSRPVRRHAARAIASGSSEGTSTPTQRSPAPAAFRPRNTREWRPASRNVYDGKGASPIALSLLHRSVAEAGIHAARGAEPGVVLRDQLLLPRDVPERHRHHLVAAHRAHRAVTLVLHHLRGRRADARGEDAIRRRRRAAAQQVAEDREPRLLPRARFELLRELERVRGMALVELVELVGERAPVFLVLRVLALAQERLHARVLLAAH